MENNTKRTKYSLSKPISQSNNESSKSDIIYINFSIKNSYEYRTRTNHKYIESVYVIRKMFIESLTNKTNQYQILFHQVLIRV